MTYQRSRLLRPLKQISSCDGFRTYMLSVLSLPDVATRQPPGGTTDTLEVSPSRPLVLKTDSRNSLTPTTDETELSHDVLNPARVPL